MAVGVRAPVAMEADRLVAAVAEDHVRVARVRAFPERVDLLVAVVAAPAVVAVLAVPPDDVLQNGRGVVVATAKSSSR